MPGRIAGRFSRVAQTPGAGVIGGGGAKSAYCLDSFDRDNGAIGNGWIGATWTISGNKAINTPVGTELAPGGNMSSWAAGLPTGFTKYSTPTISQVAPNEGYGGTGTGAANIYASATSQGLRSPAFTAATAKWLRLAYAITKRVSGTLLESLGFDYSRSAEGTYIHTTWGGATYAGFYSSGGAADITIDDVTLRQFLLPEICALRPMSPTADVRVSAEIVMNDRAKQAGIAFLDSTTDPKNGLLVYIHVGPYNAALRVDKIVDGAQANVSNTTISLASITQAHTLIVHKVADTYFIRYRNLATGSYTERLNTSATISETAILACKYFGVFAPDSGITINDYTQHPSSAVHKTYWIGDSKMTQTYNNCPWYFQNSRVVCDEAPDRYATSGILMAGVRAGIDAALAATTETPEFVFFNVGVNDANATPVTDETQFKADMQYILDAVHAKWPAAKIFAMSGVYKASRAADSATVSGWIKTVIAANAYVTVWADELVWFAPNMATYSSDGTHYSVAGCQEAARLGMLAMGL